MNIEEKTKLLNEVKSKDLEKFRKNYRTVTSGDLQTFCIGWDAAVEKFPNFEFTEWAAYNYI